MGQSLANVVLHAVFSTKNREPYIQTQVEQELHQYLCGVCRNLNCPVIQINGMADHIHILFQLARTQTISNLLSEIKSSSSHWIKSKGDHYKNFSWQSGYGIFSVSSTNIPYVRQYILNQKEHHKILTYKEELINMLKRADLKHDEKYLWD